MQLLHGNRGETNKAVPICLLEEATNPCLPAGSDSDQTWTSCERRKWCGTPAFHRDSWLVHGVCYVNLPSKRILCEEAALKTEKTNAVVMGLKSAWKAIESILLDLCVSLLTWASFCIKTSCNLLDILSLCKLIVN